MTHSGLVREQFLKSLQLLKGNSLNVSFCNDSYNFLITGTKLFQENIDVQTGFTIQQTHL